MSWQPLPAADQAFGEFQPPPRFDVRTARDVMALPDPPASHTLLGPLVFRGHRTIIVGDTGHGKTSFALSMLRAILTGDTMLGHPGAGAGPVLVIDLEQGVKSIKRGLREAHLDGRDDLLHVSAPDGLALDRDEAHLVALNEALSDHRPVAVLLDPYYKAHRADDPNAERPIVDLMRRLDALRVIYEFALILPAHPRKDAPGHIGARKLTIGDVAGSGAVTRGAEIVLGLERLGTGYARLRYLKDRDGELAIGDTVTLLYDRETGFRLDPKDEASDEQIEQRILAVERPWLTVKEWAAELKIREGHARTVLESLAARTPPDVGYMIGPPGRSPKAHCYATAPEVRAQSGAVTPSLFETVTAPTAPTSLIGEVGAGRSRSNPTAPGSSHGAHTASDDDDGEWF